MVADVSIRPATPDDIDDLVRLRRMMFESMGVEDPAALDAGDKAAATYFGQAIPAGEFHGWLAVTPAGEAVAASGVVIAQHPPGPSNLSGRIGYIMNVVTAPQYRRRGMGRQVMGAALAWLEGQGITRSELHATDVGQPLYEEFGFVDSHAMKLTIPV
ncbi:MAG: GNAT family N-acetyltransferase [Anaerolineales bacterium]|nr:MAG: GNAT family N-acetyltransferase [Anaerolineales bacterium]